MKKRQYVIVAIGLGVIAISFLLNSVLAGMKEDPEKKPVIEIKKFVKTAPVQYGDVNTWVTAYGRVSTAQTLDMIAEVSGRMSEGVVRLKEGQSFKKGDLLYNIDNTEASLNLNAQKSNFLRDLAGILPDIKIDFTDNFDAWSNYFESIDIEKPLPQLPKHKSSKEKTFLATKTSLALTIQLKVLKPI